MIHHLNLGTLSTGFLVSKKGYPMKLLMILLCLGAIFGIGNVLFAVIALGVAAL